MAGWILARIGETPAIQGRLLPHMTGVTPGCFYYCGARCMRPPTVVTGIVFCVRPPLVHTDLQIGHSVRCFDDQFIWVYTLFRRGYLSRNGAQTL
jgi:hypothetical protein